ncbi:copper chaperone PCu(A)C [Piscinibacter sp. HJYY11]|uniref:copper chaperone PCu(A)C n=1 Tax=Piscinibacter sp. HJYY11 TaxID=2801333 RepID=UPI00191E53BD|nr:copper chaperone PCu(A)C [Piscinibacter sp. HJYY11]MBL0728489.1 copper chaperone PCu(A)C [Piscinibacter sp. HJYY11]
MKIPHRLLAALSLSAIAWAAQAHSFKLGKLTIGHPYARSTAPGQPAGGAYLSIRNAGAAGDKLVSASADVSRSVELHEMKMDGDVMRMREVSAVEVPAGKAVELKPGGLHIMLMGLKAPLKQGEKFPLKLKFEKAGEVTVTVNVEGPGASHDMKH